MVTEHLQCQWQGLIHPKKNCLWHIILVIKAETQKPIFLYSHCDAQKYKQVCKYIHTSKNTPNFE